MSVFRRIRNPNLSAALAGVAVASWGFHFYLWSHFMDVQPRQAQPSEGLTYVMNNHGWYFYLSATQSTQLELSVYIAIAAAILAAITGVAVPVKKPWELYAKPVKLSIGFAMAAILAWTIGLCLWSYPCAAFLVSKGMIFDRN